MLAEVTTTALSKKEKSTTFVESKQIAKKVEILSEIQEMI